MTFQFSAYRIAELAAEVEGASTSFYKRLALSAQDQAIQETFDLLSQQEDAHKKAFTAIANALKSKNEEYEYTIDLHGVLKYTLEKLRNTAFPSVKTVWPKDIIEALDVAVKSEEAAVNAYTQLRNTLSERFHKTLDGILQAEQYHCKYVSDLRDKVRSM